MRAASSTWSSTPGRRSGHQRGDHCDLCPMKSAEPSGGSHNDRPIRLDRCGAPIDVQQDPRLRSAAPQVARPACGHDFTPLRPGPVSRPPVARRRINRALVAVRAGSGLGSTPQPSGRRARVGRGNDRRRSGGTPRRRQYAVLVRVRAELGARVARSVTVAPSDGRGGLDRSGCSRQRRNRSGRRGSVRARAYDAGHRRRRPGQRCGRVDLVADGAAGQGRRGRAAQRGVDHRPRKQRVR